MTVKELIEELQKCDPDRLVIMASDAEGNKFSPLSALAAENCAYEPCCSWDGEMVLEYLTPQLEAVSYTEEDLGSEKAVKAVFFWPTN